MDRSFVALRVVLPLVFGACASSSTTASGTPINLVTNGSFSATINGTAWSALGRVVVSRGAGNYLAFSAVSTTYGMTIALQTVTGPGTVSLTSSISNGSQVTVANVTGMGWSTSPQGGTGSITITTLTASRVVGTFAFNAVPVPGGGATSTLQVTNGVFDVTY